MYSSKSKKRPWKTILFVTIITLVVVGLGVTAASEMWFKANIKPLNASNSTTQAVVITKGLTVDEIAKELSDKRLIKNAQAFRWYVTTNGARNQLQAGTYRLSPSMSVEDIVTMMKEGKVATDLVTILPAQRVDQIQVAFQKAGYSQADIAAAFEVKKYATHPVFNGYQLPTSLEGYLYPNSYQRDSNTTIEQILTQSLNQMQKYLTPDVQAGFAAHNLSVYQGITLASIVENEVSNPTDRPVVAQVFLKRLHDGMMLGSDVTYFYAAAISGQPASPSLDSPYNTRKYSGLPPGPISNVSAVSLNAVARPANTDWLFFVAGDDGKTYFSHTEAEHNQLAKDHCQKLCSL